MGDDPLRPMARTRLYEQVVERLRDFVATVGLRAGDRLPAERELAGRLSVSRASVREAIVALEVQGLVEVRHGGGTYLLRDRLQAEPLQTLIERRRRLPDVLDARDAIETKLAALAAARRTDEDLAAIEAALAAMRKAIAEDTGIEDADARFHGAIISAAHSPLLAEFMAEIAGQVAESRAESLRQPGRSAQSLEQHERVANAIHAADPPAAAEAMRRHVQSVGQVKLLDWHGDHA